MRPRRRRRVDEAQAGDLDDENDADVRIVSLLARAVWSTWHMSLGASADDLVSQSLSGPRRLAPWMARIIDGSRKICPPTTVI